MDDILEQIKAFGAKVKGPKATDDIAPLLERMRGATFHQESGGDYQVKPNSRTNATGGFQVMPGNIPAWTKTHYGRSLTREQFEADPNAQEAVFTGEMGRYLKKAKSLAPDDDTAIRMAAAAWYGGEDDMSNYDANFGGKGNEPTFREYTNSVLERTKKLAKPYEVPKGTHDFSKVRELLGEQPEAASATPDFSKVKSILGVEDNNIVISRPNGEPVAAPVEQTAQAPTANRLTPPVKQVLQANQPAPTAPVPPLDTGGSVSVDQIDMNDPGVQAALAEQRAQLNEDFDAPTTQELKNYAGIKTETPRIIGKANDNLNSVAGFHVPKAGTPKEQFIEAVSTVGSKYGITPQEAREYAAKAYGADAEFFNKDGDGRIGVTFDVLNAVKPGVIPDAIRMEQAQARTEVEALPPSQLLTKDLLEQLYTKTGLNLEAGFAAAGARTSRFAGGLMRLLDPAVIAGLENAPGEGDQQIRAYGGQDAYKWMQQVADAPEKNAAALNDGLYSEIFQMAGGLPSDLSRVMIASSVLPGGIVTATSLDMAAQSAGRGEDMSEVKRQAVKGAILGSFAKALAPVTKGVTNFTGSRLAGVEAGLGSTAVGTYGAARLFGADPNEALKETIYNTVMGLGDAVGSLKGRTVRAKGLDGSQVAFHVDFNGQVREITIKPGEHADVEILDTNKPITTKLETKPVDMTDEVYQLQKQKADDYRAGALARDKDLNVQQAVFRTDKDGNLKVDAAGNVLVAEAYESGSNAYLSDLYDRYVAAGDTTKAADIKEKLDNPQGLDFFGAYLNRGQAQILVEGLDGMREYYATRGKSAEAKRIEEAKGQVLKAIDQDHGDIVIGTDLTGIAPDLEKGVMTEELGHRNNRRSGARAAMDRGQFSSAEIDHVKSKIGPVYDHLSDGGKVDEAVAQNFRDDAETHLGITKKESRAGRRSLHAKLEDAGIDAVAYSEAIKGNSRKGEAFNRYAKLKQRAETEAGIGVAGERGTEVVPSGAAQGDPAVRSLSQTRGPGTGDSGRSDGRTLDQPPTVQRRGVPEPAAGEVVGTPGREAEIVSTTGQKGTGVAALKEQRDTARRASETDPLTGVANRQALDKALPSAEADPNTSVIAFDANNFGKINKVVSQEAGDQALKEVADAIKQAAAEQGGTRVFRRGGDEFVVLAPKEKAAAIRSRAEEIFGDRDYSGVKVSLSGTEGNTFSEADSTLQTAKAARKRLTQVEPGDFVRMAGKDYKYLVDRIEGDHAVILDAHNFIGEDAEIRMPVSELEIYQKLDTGRDTPAGRTEDVQVRDTSVSTPDINDIADYRRADEPKDDSLMLAARQSFKENKIFEKADQEKVIEMAATDFPALARWFGKKPTDAPTSTVDPDPVVEQRFKDARGLDQGNRFQSALGSLAKVYHSFRRTFPELDPNKNSVNAEVNDSFRRLTAVPHWGKVKAQDTMAQITADLGPNNFATFERIIQLRDVQREAEKGLQPDLGFNDLTHVEASLKHFEAEALKYPEIQKALDIRERLIGDVTKEMVRLDLLPASVLEDPRYYHRQIMSAMENIYGDTGSKDVRLHRKGFQKTRQGEKGDYNTNYLESEGEWLSQAYASIAKYGIQQEIETAANTAPQLKKEAKLRGVSDWTSLIDKKTHTLWQPKEGNYFFRVETIPDTVLNDVIGGVIKPADIPAHLKDAIGLGRRKPEWVVPKEIARLLDNFKPDRPDEAISSVAAKVNSSIKQWMLINPKNFAGYNLRNAVSDLDVVLASYPTAVKEVYPAFKALMDYRKDRGGASAKLIQDAIADGVIDSGQTFAEIPDINKIGVFKHITDEKTGLLLKTWDGLKGSSNFRENLLRLAVYQHLQKQIDAGVPVYGASNKGQVDAITNPRLKAAKVARELMGDYGGISEYGRVVRRHMLPFYSWLEINAPRYVRMFKNIPHEGKSFSLGPALVGKGLKVAAAAPRRGLQATAMATAMVLWNNYGPYGDHEEKLKRTDAGRQPHLIVGEREDGTPMVIRMDTALTDAFGWLDMGDVDADINDLTTGKSTVGDKLADAAKGPFNRMVNAVGPQYKLPLELAFGQSAFPSLLEKGASVKWKSRSIRDRWEYAAQAASVDGIYKKVIGRPAPPRESLTVGGVTRSIADTFLTSRVDTNEAIYWNAASDVRNYAEKIGKSSQSAEPTEKSNALFFYRQALKWDDEGAAKRYLDKYYELGGTDAGMQKSMDKSHPLGGLDNEVWGQYIRTLTQEQRNQLHLALNFYKATYGQDEKVGSEEGATVEDLYKKVFPKPVRLISESGTTIPMAVDLYENAGLSAEESKRVKTAIQLRAVQAIRGKTITMEDQAALKRIGINLVADTDVQMLQNAGKQKKHAQELKKAARFGY